MDRTAMDRLVRDEALALGFDAVGVARADVPLGVDFTRYEAFVDAGMHGTMRWLAEDRHVRRRLDEKTMLEGAKSVICVAKRYRGERDEGEGIVPKIAAYARGQDYHKFLRKRVRRLAAFVRALGEGVEARPLLDDAPILERAWAARAGLGFIGKNGLLIAPGLGSFVLLGEVVTTLELTPDTPMQERCGTCTRCLDACPTNAFARPFVLDARRCISYLTIEHRGPIDVRLRDDVGSHLFGCDVCQDVCPFNQGRAKDPLAPLSHHDPFAALERWKTADLGDLFDEARFESLGEGSPLRRAGAIGLVRNAILVAANENRADLLPRIDALCAHPNAEIAEMAAWAGEKLRRNACGSVKTNGHRGGLGETGDAER